MRSPSHSSPRSFPALLLMTVLLLVAAALRTITLTTAPPGLAASEFINIQLVEAISDGRFSLIYTQVEPAREGAYHVLLALWTLITGYGQLMWRLPSAWASLIATALIFSLYRRLWGVRRAVFAAALMAFSFWPVWLGRAAVHYALLPAAASLALYCFVRAMDARGRRGEIWFTGGAVMVAASLYIHRTAWALIPVIVLYLIGRLRQRRLPLYDAGNLFYAAALTATLLLPLLAAQFNTGLPALPSGALLERIAGVGSGLFLQGDSSAAINLPGRPLMGPVIALLALVGLLSFMLKPSQPANLLAPSGLLFSGLAAALGGLRPTDFEAVAILLPFIWAFPAQGLATLGSQAPRLRPWLIGAGVLLMLSTVAFSAYDLFYRWAPSWAVEQAYHAEYGLLAHALDTRTIQDGAALALCDLPAPNELSPLFPQRSSDVLAVMMHRQNAAVRSLNCAQSLLLPTDEAPVYVIIPGGREQITFSPALVPWLADAQPLSIAGLPEGSLLRLQSADESGALSETLRLPPEAGGAQAALPLSFEDDLTLLAYAVPQHRARPGEVFEVLTLWQVDEPRTAPISVFVHLLSNPVVVLAQDDGLGAAPSTLQEGDRFIQVNRISVPSRAAPGSYELSLGIYETPSGRRLIIDAAAERPINRLSLGQVRITGP